MRPSVISATARPAPSARSTNGATCDLRSAGTAGGFSARTLSPTSSTVSSSCLRCTFRGWNCAHRSSTEAHLEETQKKLTTLRTGRGEAGANAVISEQQRAAIDELRKDVTATRVKLRNVQLELRRDIISLESRLRMFNIFLVPALLTVLAVGLGVLRRRRRAAARA